MTTRKPAATEQEVRDAMASASNYGIGLLTAPTYAGIVANARGCKESWPSTETVREYVPLRSVKAMLTVLAEAGEVYPVKGDHWAIKNLHGIYRAATYWLTPHQRQLAIQRAEEGHASTVAAKAEKHAAKALRKAHEAEYQQYLEDYARLYPVPDFKDKW